MGAGGSKGMETQTRSEFMVNSVQNITDNGVTGVSITMKSSNSTSNLNKNDKKELWDTGQLDMEEKDDKISDVTFPQKSCRHLESASQNDVDKLGKESTSTSRKLSLKLNRVLSASDIMSKFKRSHERSVSTNRKKSIKDGPLKVEHSRSSSAPVIENPTRPSASEMHKTGSLAAVNKKSSEKTSTSFNIGDNGRHQSTGSLDGKRGRNRSQKSKSNEFNSSLKQSKRSASTHRLQGGTEINVQFLESLKSQRSSSVERGRRRKGTVKPPQLELLHRNDQGNDSKSKKKSQIRPSDSETEERSSIDNAEAALHHRRSSSTSSLDLFLASSASVQSEEDISKSVKNTVDKVTEISDSHASLSVYNSGKRLRGKQEVLDSRSQQVDNNSARKSGADESSQQDGPPWDHEKNGDFLITFSQLDLYLDSLIEFEVSSSGYVLR